ncbi:MAG: Gfo/Idh/MocA family oxidoreductase, partial [Chloroflexota bacterium]
MTVRTCVIGVGRMGANHARCLHELPEAELLAVADASEDRVQEMAAKFGCRAYTSHTEMLARERPEAVVIAVPTPMHYAVASDAIAGGCHVLIEKPLADDAAQARQIIDFAREKGVRLAVGHVERFNPAVRKLKEIMEEGQLGRILSISTRRVGLPSPHFRETNVVVDLAVHDLDVISFLLGQRPRVLSSVTGRLRGGRGRRPQRPWQGVEAWATALPEDAWRRIDVRDGAKGPLVVDVVKRRVVSRTPKRQQGHEEMVVVMRYRDRDKQEVVKVDYSLSNAVPETPLGELARVAKAEHRIEA